MKQNLETLGWWRTEGTKLVWFVVNFKWNYWRYHLCREKLAISEILVFFKKKPKNIEIPDFPWYISLYWIYIIWFLPSNYWRNL